MNTADRDLIIGMIAETLSPEESAAAQTRLDSDPAFAALHAEQLAVKARLSDVMPVAMTTAERADLRASLIDQLALDTAPPKTARAPRRRFRIWQPVAGLAAAAAVVAGFAIIPGAISGSSDSADEVASAAFSDVVSQEELDGSVLPPPRGDDESGDSTAETEDLFIEGEMVDVLDTAGATIDDLVNAAAGESSPRSVQESLTDTGLGTTLSIDGSQMEQCLHQAENSFPEGLLGVVLFGAEKAGDTTIAHFGLEFASGIRAGLSIDLSTCEVVFVGE